MSHGAGPAALAADLLGPVRESLDELLRETGGRLGMLMDGSGTVILEAGSVDGLDSSAFARLTMSHLGAASALASLVGERAFTGLCHQGEHTSIFVAHVAGRVVLSVLFDGRKAAGKVSQDGRRIVSNLEEPVRRLLASGAPVGRHLDADWVEAVRDEIDRIFMEGA